MNQQQIWQRYPPPPQKKSKARTTNPNKALSSEYTPDEDKSTSCAWNQTEGVDGPASRSTFISVTRAAKDDNVVTVEYSGWDSGFPRSKQPDIAALEAMARTMAEEMISKL